MGVRRPLAWLALLLLAVASCVHDPPSRPLVQAPSTNSYVAAGVITGTAAVIYAVGGGCRISGCPTGTVCNPHSERCMRLECGPGAVSPDCPNGLRCDVRSNACVAF